MPIIVQHVAGDSSVFHDISAALDNHLSLMAGLPPVAWENKDFAPVKNALYLRPINMQGETVAVTQDKDETIGVYTIGIYAPVGKGKNAVVTMSDLVADHFAQDSSVAYLTQSVRVKNVSRTPIVVGSDGWLYMTVDVVYYAFSDRR